MINGPGEYEVGGVLILGMRTYHDAGKGAQRGKNTLYLMQVDEVSICHLGDLGHVLNEEMVEDLGNIDVLMLPVGGVSTISASEAAEIVRLIEPRIVLPMHYQTEAFKGKLQPVEPFLKEMGVSEIEPLNRLNVTKTNLPLTTQVTLLSL